MPKYYCDYCDVFLTHDSSSVRKAHNSGRNHLTNVRDYYNSLGSDKAQNIIDEITKMYESGQGARQPLPPQPSFNQPPPSFNQPPPGNFGGGGGGFGGPPPQFGGPPPQFNGPPQDFRPPPGMPMGGVNPDRARALGLG